ncbi:hypothetical protein CORC01_11642 [Colletotrichum orchidophilum]|uniref:Zn(2)-C6 fungal-type domain-containing protein n=1 Tax=Colletotrichum orchidophilum TaxID=1209926 RepID=A0A1G4AVF6_9PEZI|nr:uncharacterized protein CORC01_11642 [Colletotrichum orchidophilum]OHE93085.1 hypothetical protein CORC01_11642 [Colletotrichum orchidophilum]
MASNQNQWPNWRRNYWFVLLGLSPADGQDMAAMNPMPPNYRSAPSNTASDPAQEQQMGSAMGPIHPPPGGFAGPSDPAMGPTTGPANGAAGQQIPQSMPKVVESGGKPESVTLSPSSRASSSTPQPSAPQATIKKRTPLPNAPTKRPAQNSSATQDAGHPSTPAPNQPATSASAPAPAAVRHPAHPAAAAAAAAVAPAAQQPQRQICRCNWCMKKHHGGRTLAAKTVKEHMRAQEVERIGSPQEAQCERCAKGHHECIIKGANSPCSVCMRMSEKCSFTGSSVRVREMEKRARLAQQQEEQALAAAAAAAHQADQQPEQESTPEEEGAVNETPNGTVVLGQQAQQPVVNGEEEEENDDEDDDEEDEDDGPGSRSSASESKPWASSMSPPPAEDDSVPDLKRRRVESPPAAETTDS